MSTMYGNKRVIKHDFAKADIVGILIAPSLCRASHIALVKNIVPDPIIPLKTDSSPR